MERFVVDNSIVMTWCFVDETNPLAEKVLDSFNTAQVFVPAVWPLEVVNILLVAERRQRLDPADSARFLTLLAKLPIVVKHDPTDGQMGEHLLLGRESGLSSYDASYLALAIREGVPLATLDGALIAAAEKLGVEILRP